MSTELDIHDLEEMSRELLDLTPDGWNRSIYFDLSKLAEEVGETAECLNKTKKTKEELGHELADVIGVVMIIALKTGIDMNEVIPIKQEKRVAKLLNRFHDGKHPLKKNKE